MWAESVIKTPAEPALEPLGATYTIMGTLEFKIFWTISLVDSSKPPGVFNSIINASADILSAQ
ncbi:MAG: hypothetical protein ACK42Z_10220, partial [Candidatus Kapaibacteriota bacterium]